MSDPLAGLDPRQRKYLEHRAKGKTKLDSALAAGYSLHMARAAAVKVEKPEVKEAFARLVRQYVPAHRIAKRLQEGLDAMETKFFQKDGAVTDSRDVVNFAERRAYAELAANIGGYIEESKSKAPNVGVRVVVEHIGTQDQASAQTIATVEAVG